MKMKRIKIIALGVIAISVPVVASVSLAAYSKAILIQHDGRDLEIGAEYSKVTIDFIVNYDTSGDGMYVYNNLGTVGGVEFPEYLPMYWNDDNYWKYTISVPINTSFEYKYVVASAVDPEVSQTWELGGTASLTREYTASASDTINVAWNSAMAYFEVKKDAGANKSIYVRAPQDSASRLSQNKLTWHTGNIWSGTLYFDYSGHSGGSYAFFIADSNNPYSNIEEGSTRTYTFDFSNHAFHNKGRQNW